MHFSKDRWGQKSFHLVGHLDIPFGEIFYSFFFFRLSAYEMQSFTYQLSGDQKVWKYSSDEKMEKQAFPL